MAGFLLNRPYITFGMNISDVPSLANIIFISQKHFEVGVAPTDSTFFEVLLLGQLYADPFK